LLGVRVEVAVFVSSGCCGYIPYRFDWDQSRLETLAVSVDVERFGAVY
jgi:hypothetical protein